MKMKTQRKLSKRFISFITCLCLVAETLFGYGSLTAYATSNTQTQSSDISTSSNTTNFDNSVISDEATVTDNSTTTNDTKNSTDATTPSIPATSSDSTTSNNSDTTNATTSSSTDASNTATPSSTDASTASMPSSTDGANTATSSSVSTTNTTTPTTLTENLITIDNLNFPDEIFIEYISSNYDTNKDNKLSKEEISAVIKMDVSNLSITSLKGIEYFTNLIDLNCSNNDLTSLKIDSLIDLVSLNCSWNHLTNLNVEKNVNLTNLECVANSSALLIDDKSSFDLTTLLDFDIEQTKNWSTTYTTEDSILTFDTALASSIITYESSLNYPESPKEEPITFTFVLYKDDFEPIEINDENFPDIELQKLITTVFDKDKDSILDSEEIIPITSLDISKLTITNLTGVQNLKNLTYFNYSSTQKSDLDLTILPATTIFYCDNLPVVTEETDTSSITPEETTNVTSDTAVTTTATTTTPSTAPFETLPPATTNSVPANTVATSYTVSFDSMGGSGANPVTVNANTAIDGSILPTNPTKAGCTFDGWYFENSFINKFSTITTGLTQNITLYAKWNQLTVNSTKIKSAKNSGKGKLNVSYNGIDNVAGYEVICSTSKNFKSNVRTTSKNSTSVTISGLIKNKTYYVKVRGYVVDSTGQNVYSDYSSVKKVKVTSGVSEVKATSSSAKISSSKITDANTVTIKAKASNVVKSSDSYYYLFSVPSSKTSLKGLQPIATSEKTTSMTFYANLDKDGANSLLQSKFVIAVKQKSSYKIISAFRYISNPEAVAEYTYAFPTAPTKKGLQDYSSSLGVNHTVINIEVNDMIANPAEYGNSNIVEYNYKGNTYYFRKDAVRGYANLANYYSEKGAVVYAILLLGWSSKPELITPKARQEGYAYYAWNTKDQAVKDKLEAAITYLAQYCCSKSGDGPGIAGWIVGNEVDNFDTWNYAGTSNLNSYTQIYADTFRLVYNATKSVYSNARVYVSLDHMWGMSNEGSFGSKAFLEKFNSILASEGNIDWDIAYHPYPVPLTETKFWKNDFISNNENSDVVNIKNLNVLTNYVKKHYGKDKRVILSEVGFTATSGEKVQAAAIAYAYYVAEFNPMVDAIIMRSLNDAPVEVDQGLAFGIKNRQAYDVFKYMDTPQSESYTKFALKVIGTKKWKSIVPKYNVKKFRSMPNR